ncbi:carboxypeptidase-like regulatory domain-containing protein [Lutibacter sp.]
MIKQTFFLVLCFLTVIKLHSQAKNTDNTTTSAITIYWDASFSMKDKDLSKEIDFLANYFNNIPTATVQLIVFSNTIDFNKKFSVSNGNWEALKEILISVPYDGVAFYNALPKNIPADLNLVFTDGISVFDTFSLSNKAETYIVSSNKNAAKSVLKKQAKQLKGAFVDLSKITLKEALALLHIQLEDLVGAPAKKVAQKPRLSSRKLDAENTLNIRGTVSGAEGYLAEATVTIKGTDIGVVTNEKGQFRLRAKRGDILVFGFLGKKTKEIPVQNSTQINVLLVSNENELEEVIVKGEGKKETEDVGYGETNKDRIGYEVQTIGAKKLNKSATDVSMSVRGRVSGVTKYGQNDDISQMVLRANSILSNVFPLILIDGTPVRRSSSVGKIELTNFIDPNNIAKIQILKGLAATNRWGSEGSNGVILITTQAAVSGTSSNGKPYDRARLRNNIFKEDLKLVSTTINTKYIKELRAKKTLSEVYHHYLNQRENYTNDFQYFGNVSTYISQWGDKDLAAKILLNVVEIAKNDIQNLRYVAYKAEEQGNFLLAKKVYEKIKDLAPKEAQSYRDLALIYQEIGLYKEALKIYQNIKDHKYSDVNFSGIMKNIDSEMRHLLLLHKGELDVSSISENYFKPLNYDARIVFDWNKRDAEFDLQFVNPNKQFFTWSHTKGKNAMRLSEEKTQGYNTEEFLLIDAEKGEWLVNIESKIKKSKKPVVIKYTIYRNFGKKDETKESKLLILNTIKGKQMAGKIEI